MPNERTYVRPMSPADQPTRNWHVIVDGHVLPDVSEVLITSDSFGTLAYGCTPGGHDGWSFREVGGGGAVIAPFVYSSGQLYVGVIRQERHNQGGDVWNIPRGFMDVGEAHDRTAARELVEETGYDGSIPFELPGAPVNPNSTFFETPTANDGVRFFAVEVSESDVAWDKGELRFAADRLRGADESRLVERISSALFVPWQDAVRLSDMFTVAAVARLLAHTNAASSG